MWDGCGGVWFVCWGEDVDSIVCCGEFLFYLVGECLLGFGVCCVGEYFVVDVGYVVYEGDLIVV